MEIGSLRLHDLTTKIAMFFNLRQIKVNKLWINEILE